MPDLQVQCLVKRDFQPVFTPDNMPRLLYISRRAPSDNAHPRLLHAHPDFAEAMLVHSGQARFLIGEKTYDIQGGDLMLFNSGVVHDELTGGADGAIDSCCVAFAGLRLPGLRENALIPDDAPAVYHVGAELEDLWTLYDMMYRYLSADQPGCEAFCHHLLLSLLGRILYLTGAAPQRLPAETEQGALGLRVKEYIDQHYSEPLTLQQIGQVLHMSPYYLAHAFKETCGFSPRQYLLRRRIGEAQNLLISTDLPISRIAELVGYDTQNYFDLQFSKYTGIPPRKFRQSFQVKPEQGKEE